jgi:hypothetical protein
VIYAVGYGASDQSAETEVVVVHGSTVIARGSDEAGVAALGTPRSGHNLCGYHKITGDGSNPLKLQFRCMVADDTAYIMGSTLIAIPLDDLAEDDDYFVSVQNGDTAEASTSSADVEVLSADFTLPETGDYLVLGSMEGTISTVGDSGDGWTMYLQIGGVTQKVAFEREWEDDSSSVSFSYARIHALNSGSNTIRLMGGIAQGAGETYGFRRGRLIVLNMQSFDQYDDDPLLSSDSETEVTTTYPSYTTLLTASTYTPNQEEYVLTLGNMCTRGAWLDYSQISRIRNTTDATSLCAGISSISHDTDGVLDVSTLTVAACEQFSTGKVYELHGSGYNAAVRSAYFNYPDLVIVSLTTAAAGGSYTKTLTETAVGSASRAEGGSIYGIELTEAAEGAQAPITAPPSGPAYHIDGATGDDSNDGRSSGSAWRTFQKAADVAPEGAIIYVWDYPSYAGFDLQSHVASATNPTQFIGVGSAAIINRVGNGWNHPYIYYYNSSYVHLYNIIVRGELDEVYVPGPGQYHFSPLTVINGTDNEVHNCTFNRALGSLFSSQTNRLRYYDSLFDDLARRVGSSNQHTGYVTDCLIDGNIFRDDYLVTTNWGLSNSRYTNNLFYGNLVGDTCIKFFGDQITPSNGGYEQYSPACINNIIANNTFVNTRGGAITLVSAMGGGTQPPHDNYIFNNIGIVDLDGVRGGNNSSNFVSGDNIFEEVATFDQTTIFSDPDNDDYTILDSGPAHNTGIAAYLGKPAPSIDIVGVTRPQATFFDMGAYEIYHGTGSYTKNFTETGTGTDSKTEQKWMAREFDETSIASQTLAKVGAYIRELTETARATWGLRGWWDSTPEYFEHILIEVGRGLATLARTLTMSKTLDTETATGTDTLDRTGTIITRALTETALGEDQTIDAALPAPAAHSIAMGGYVTNGTVGAETG